MKGDDASSWSTYEPLVPHQEDSSRPPSYQTAVVDARVEASEHSQEEIPEKRETYSKESFYETRQSIETSPTRHAVDVQDSLRHVQEEKLAQHPKLIYEYDQFEMSAESTDHILDAVGSEHQRDYATLSNSSWLSSILNSIASIFGAGYVGIPYALSLAGLPLGIILLIIMAIISGKA
jgi:hypothetical protein